MIDKPDQQGAIAGSASGGIEVRSATITYRNGHTAMRDASFVAPSGTITAPSYADPSHLTYVAYEQGAAKPPATDSLPSLAGRHW